MKFLRMNTAFDCVISKTPSETKMLTGQHFATSIPIPVCTMSSEVVLPIDENTGNLVIFLVFLVVYGSILLWSTFSCTLFTVSLYRGRKVLSQWPFFIIVRNLTISDGVFLLNQIFNTFPDMIRDSTGSSQLSNYESWFNSIPVTASVQLLDFIPNKGLIYLSLLMTVNRLAVFVYPSWRRVFDRLVRGTIIVPILSCWACIITMCTMSVLVTPTKRFNKEILRFENNGAPLFDAPAAFHVMQGLDYIVPFIIAGMYVRIYQSIRARRGELTTDSLSEDRLSEDRKILTQALVIAVFLELYSLTTLAEMFLSPGGWVLMFHSFPDMIRDTVGCNQSYVNLNETFARADSWTNSVHVSASLDLFHFVPNKGLIYLSLLMTLNRLAVFVYPKWRRIFDKYSLHPYEAVCERLRQIRREGTILYPILTCWVIVMSLAALTLVVTPTQKFNKETLRFEANGEPLIGAPWLMHTLFGIDYLVPFIIAAMYLRIYYAIRASRRVLGQDWVSEERSAEDRKMLKQALIICGFLVLYNIANLLAMVFESVTRAQRLFGMCELILSVLNHSIHATLFIMTNSTIRKFLPVPSKLCSKSIKRGQPSVATSADKQYN
ncbi:hypothetical protein PRIPAC_79229 [Pristionchus pacificus]|uniref:G protein-coupled receptor n=1 Tax=Pristionchus pacificus TaxID=54126 RepID=A0A2A6CL35_PRIPA|nr:hypothetical protein PRIPAC_79229 [Pristionchus pacificus]|eukprot:PDM78826.1 G protein-coupled receptor [Pristionchus pacificus]